MGNKIKFTKKPFSFSKDVGYFNVEANLQNYYMAEGLPKTSTAIQRTCKQEIKDDNSLQSTKEDDYATSLKELFNTLDVFIEETKQKGNKKAVEPIDFNQANPYELTLHLFWQIRHILTHNAETIDENCIEKYEKILNNAKSQGITPSLLILPEFLSLDEVFIVNHEQYAHIKECLFIYIKSRVNENQFYKLANLGHIAYGKGEIAVKTCVRFDDIALEFNVEDAHENGFDMDYMRVYRRFPMDANYNFETGKIVLDNGKSFSAKLIGKRFHAINLNNTMNKYITMNHESFMLRIDLVEANNCGCKVNFITKKLIFPDTYKYNEEQERFILETGQSFSALNMFNHFEPTHPLRSQF